MHIKQFVLILTPVFLVACINSSGDDSDGNPKAKSGVVNLTTSRLGASGGFVDINADGKIDFIAGAPEAQLALDKSGAALIYLDYINNPVMTVNNVISGEEAGDFFGFSFANLGDVNADGIEDFAIGALNAEGDSGISGAVYVYQGGEYPPKLMGKLKGENAFDKFGYAISGGDVNGDGVNDVVVSAPHTFHEEFQAGAVYVFYGGPAFDVGADVIIRGDSVNASVGIAVTTGDVNGDQIADVVMDGHAKVFIYYGGDDLKQRVEADPTPNVKIRSDGGAHGGSGFGYSLAYVGDVDGDGFGDLAIGNKRRSNPTLYDNAGSLYVFKGSDSFPAEFFEDNLDFRIIKVVAPEFNEQFAASITAVGDVDGGGRPDIVVGARWANSDDVEITGNVYLFSGETLNVSDNSIDHSVNLASKRFMHEAGSAEMGAFVSVYENSLVSGRPGSNKHDGGLEPFTLAGGS